MTGPEQHAATVREGLKHRQRGTGSTNNTKKYLAALDELVALAGRADELQRERDDLKKYRDAEARALATRLEQARREAEELQGRVYAIENMPPDGYLAINVEAMRPSDEAEQARREADQLRAALWPFVDYLNPDALMQGDVWPERFREYQRIARAALAGVQADSKDSA